MKLPLLANHAPTPMPLHRANLPSPTELHTPAVCGYCGRGGKECRWLIGSTETGAFICDDCIAVADRALAERKARA